MATAEIVAIIALVITTLTSLPDMIVATITLYRTLRPGHGRHGKPCGRPTPSHPHPNAEPVVWPRAAGPAPTHRGNQEGTR